MKPGLKKNVKGTVQIKNIWEKNLDIQFTIQVSSSNNPPCRVNAYLNSICSTAVVLHIVGGISELNKS